MSKTRASFGVLAATAVTVTTLFLLPFTPKLAVRTTQIQRGDLMKTVLLEGQVGYENETPALSLQEGQISEVYVRQGQQVTRGQLLFSLDTSMEEQALASLSRLDYQTRQAAADYGEAAVLAMTKQWAETEEQKAQLKLKIEAKQIRAASDGVVGAVYRLPGEYVDAGAVLGVVHGAEKCVRALWKTGGKAQAELGAVAAVTTASGDVLTYASLAATGAPSLNEETGEAAQQLTLRLLGNGDELEIGQRVTVELVYETLSQVPLAPVEAFGDSQNLWVVENGEARPVPVSAAQRNQQYVAVPGELLGAQIILGPDESRLTGGCRVKEAKKP